MKKIRFGIILLALAAVFCTVAIAKTHKTDIVAIDTIEYTLQEEDKLSAELFIDESGLYSLTVKEMSTTGRFRPNLLITLLKGNDTVYSYETKKTDLSDEDFDIERYHFLTGLTEGEYRLEVENLTKFSDVTFVLETTFVEEKSIESINNHSFDTATEIQANSKVFGGVSVTDDIDYYVFEMPYDGYALMQMYSPELKFFKLYDESKNEIGSIGIEIEEADKIYELRSGLAKGRYYISVQPDSDFITPMYSIKVLTYEAEGFEKEYNNRKELATPIEAKVEYQGNLFGIEDEDVYTFTLSEDCGVTIDFIDTYVSKDGHYSIWLSDGKNILYSSDECGRETIALNLSKGTYYFTVSSLGYSNFTSMAYKLEVNTDKSLAICPPEEDVGTEENEPVKEEAAPFDDVKESDWYYGDIMEAKALGLIEGEGAGKYNPRGNVTVAQVVAMASRIKNDLGGVNTPIENSPVGKWYNSYITFAVNSGIIKADDFDNYEKPATRAEVAYIFANLFDKVDTEKNTIIPDVNENTKYCDSIHKLYSLGILHGDDKNGTFYPERTLTRAEAAIILLRVHNTI